MGYPSGVTSFTTKNAGDTIQPAHINDLQTEVNALENSLLNGVTHPLSISTNLTVSAGSLNVAAASSLATLQVNGNSTIAGALNVTGNSTFGTVTIAGPLTLSSGVTLNGALTLGSSGSLPIASRPAYARVSLVSSQAVTVNANMSPNWNQHDDVSALGSGIHSTSVNSSRLFLTSSGLWEIGGQIEISPTVGSTAQGGLTLQIRLNDGRSLGAQKLNMEPAASPMALQVHSGPYVATSTTDYVTMQLKWSAGSTLSLTNSTQYGTFMWAKQVSV